MSAATATALQPEPGLEPYLERPPAEVDQATLEAISNSPVDPVLAVGSDGLDRLTDPEPLKCETGWCRMPDGSGYVAVRTAMPGLTPAMVDWWFDWHPRRSERYRVWHPQAHISNSLDPPGLPGEKPYWGAVHHAVEDIGEGPIHARIEFMDPEEFGFSRGAARAAVGTILCASVGDRFFDHSRMAHVFLKEGDGLVLRSHFWLAAEIGPRLPATLPGPAQGGLGLVMRPLETLMNRSVVRRRLLGDSTLAALSGHCAEEYTNLAGILPELFEEFGPHGQGGRYPGGHGERIQDKRTGSTGR